MLHYDPGLPASPPVSYILKVPGEGVLFVPFPALLRVSAPALATLLRVSAPDSC